MTPLIAQLSKYASYHRDQRNIWTHFFGVPVIMFSVIALLSRPAVDVGGVTLVPAYFAGAAALAFYLRLDLRLGLAMAVMTTAMLFGARPIAAMSTTGWLVTSIGLFAGGWVVQFIGHYYEGRKPAFVDDLVGLLVGPYFVMAEFAFLLGLRKEVEAEITRISGPVYFRDLSTPAAPIAK
jgi:uncharacterized membrane protein YGL010W